MSDSSFWSAWAHFTAKLQARGWCYQLPQGLIVPYFVTEFNRCVEHAALNHAVNAGLGPREANGWYQVAPACRTNDMRKVDSGWHSTLFEMLVWAEISSPERRDVVQTRLVADTLDFLITKLGLKQERLLVTVFGGGEVLPGVTLPPDDRWRELWQAHGLASNAVLPVPGPKNFLLFVNQGERCGAKCEIIYRLPIQGGDRWLEIGTLILDDRRLMRNAAGDWRVEPGIGLVAGAALGLERLMTVYESCANLTEISMCRALYAAIEDRLRPDTAALFTGDVRVLVDQAKACSFVLCDSGLRPASRQFELIALMARRIRRKISALTISDWPTMLSLLERKLVETYVDRHPQLTQLNGRLVELVSGVAWPEGWNPEGYQPQHYDSQ